MKDKTENIRRVMVHELNTAVESGDEKAERARLEKEYGVGNVLNTTQLSEQYEVIGFAAPFVVVKRKADGVKGSLMFQHMPRFYFGFNPV